MLHQAAITLTVALSAVSAAAATVDKRIIGGENAKDGEFPWVVSLDGDNGICGGALLDSTTVLTAAHCMEDTVSVRAGSLQHGAGGVKVRIAAWKRHPEYALNSRRKTHPYANNDIAIVKLATPIEKSEENKISYAWLAEEGFDPAIGSVATVAGWGKQEPSVRPSGDAAKSLAKVTLPIHERALCKKLSKGVQERDTIVCAGGEGKNTCLYDSGSPLMDQETGKVIGVTSFSMRGENVLMCDQNPTVFTRVGSYISFINEHLEGSVPAAKPEETTKE